MDLSEGLCLGTASLKRDTAFVRLREPYSDSAELVEALVHAGVVSRIAACACRGSGAGAGRAGWLPPLPYRPLSLSSAGQGQRCPRPTRGTAPRVSGARQSALVCAVDAVAASASLRRVCWALDPLARCQHRRCRRRYERCCDRASVAAAAARARPSQCPPRVRRARLHSRPGGVPKRPGIGRNSAKWPLLEVRGGVWFCHDSLMRCRVLGH